MLKCILFDLDGTLVNSLPVTLNGFNHAFQEFGGRVLTPVEMMAHFGPGEREIFARILGEEYADRAEASYFSYTRSRIQEAHLFSGIDRVLKHCRIRGIPMGVVTGRGRKTTDFILDHLEIRENFACVLTHDDLTSSKPSPEGILKALKLLELQPEEALYIGDMWMDIRAAKSANCKAVSAGWDPLHDTFRAESENPDAWVATPEDFLAYLRLEYGL